MKLTVLVDNNTYIDRYFKGEPGVSYFIEDGKTNILFDTGYSGLFLENAAKMGIDIASTDYVAISHGHNDHTWGLGHLISNFTEAAVERKASKVPTIIAHPEAFCFKQYLNGEEIGSIVSADALKRYFNVTLSREPVNITENLVFLGEVERTNDFEIMTPFGKQCCSGITTDDFCLDDTALAYKSSKGLVIITGCSHSGICNIIEYAKKVCSDDRIACVIGGFHLLNPPAALLASTCEFLASNVAGDVYAGHCTDLYSKIELSKFVDVKEVGVGLILEYK
ncbi:7,8-dihydropterin-6-methyl-4-(beta-D-ribofuranosyl)-aminobenzene-5'-phosphate synthase (plasmid) [Peptoclostridium acidaminophilum DSM 3953]|uniref:7, 8-dihydropterin-6-methyl-4-(Beta-D-ribofuranosyl)-aminobenzene-5'-phosphate synthase n=1 Tax=Peptoclostridium acidaminophilum DSM 3953 TaxID=1286171 RepID=W8U9Z5_PEPAC|nr:MBL fold metallo-hydrolase [Peptoclostridium acidaminophilum]AHM57626.1 7,8-dihydropterin-6-methyl-4-(beta-D-ribofuranosyl)-aminobenzene-5'-phosphate synthase [Peptoclostridium acidaminophilum DSM 3953]